MYAEVPHLMTFTPTFTQYNDLKYTVIKTSDVIHLDQSEVLNEHPDLYTMSSNRQKVIVKYEGPDTPPSLTNIEHETYDHESIHALIDTEAWHKDPTKTNHRNVI
jgi:hypothetical protein